MRSLFACIFILCYILFIVLPGIENEPSLTRENSKTMTYENLAGPYLENIHENFTCYIRNILPGKNSTSFMFDYNDNVRLQSDEIGEVVEGKQDDGTMFVEWRFTTPFDRSDNAGKFSCHVNWKAGQYSNSGLKSKMTDNVTVICKCPNINSKICILQASGFRKENGIL